jgi:hypothetical protein
MWYSIQSRALLCEAHTKHSIVWIVRLGVPVLGFLLGIPTGLAVKASGNHGEVPFHPIFGHKHIHFFRVVSRQSSMPAMSNTDLIDTMAGGLYLDAGVKVRAQTCLSHLM